MAALNFAPDTPAPPRARAATGRKGPGVGGAGPVQRLRVATRNVAEGREVRERVYNVRDLQVAPDRPFSLVQSATMVEHVTLGRVRLIGAPACVVVDASATVHITQVLGGQLGFTDGIATVCGRPRS